MQPDNKCQGTNRKLKQCDNQEQKYWPFSIHNIITGDKTIISKYTYTSYTKKIPLPDLSCLHFVVINY